MKGIKGNLRFWNLVALILEGEAMINLADGFLFTTSDGLVCSLLASELKFSMDSVSPSAWKKHGDDLEFIYVFWGSELTEAQEILIGK